MVKNSGWLVYIVKFIADRVLSVSIVRRIKMTPYRNVMENATRHELEQTRSHTKANQKVQEKTNDVNTAW